MSPEPSNAPPVAPEPGHRHLTIQMEIAGIPTVVDSGGGIGHISRQEPTSQPNTPTLRAPFTGLNEEAGQSPALSRNGRPRLHPQPRRVRTTARSDVSAFEERRRHSWYYCDALCSFGAGRFLLGAPGVFGKVKGINWVPVCSARERAVPDKDAEAICKQRCQSSGI